jgi:hypothetical protein
MAEIVPSGTSETSHRIGHEAFFLDVYRLLCHVLASPAFASLEDGSSQRPLSTFVTVHEKTEISRLLVSVAAYYRVKYDDGNWEHGFWLHKSFQGVGELTEDLQSPSNVVQLDFKEACNKIIHAKRVHFDAEVNPETKAEHLTPKVHLYGTKGKFQWKATLNVVEFCRAAANVIV